MPPSHSADDALAQPSLSPAPVVNPILGVVPNATASQLPNASRTLLPVPITTSSTPSPLVSPSPTSSPSSSTTTTTAPQHKSGVSPLTLGIAIGAVAFLLLLVLAIYLCVRHRRRSKYPAAVYRAGSLSRPAPPGTRRSEFGFEDSREAFGAYDGKLHAPPSTQSLPLSELNMPLHHAHESPYPQQPPPFSTYTAAGIRSPESFPRRPPQAARPSLDSLSTRSSPVSTTRTSHETVPTPPPSPPTGKPDFARLLFAAGLQASASAPSTAAVEEDVFVLPRAMPPSVSAPLPRMPSFSTSAPAQQRTPSIVVTAPHPPHPHHPDYSPELEYDSSSELDYPDPSSASYADSDSDLDFTSSTSGPHRAIALRLSLSHTRPALPTSFPTASFSPVSASSRSLQQQQQYPVSPYASTASLSSSSGSSSEEVGRDSPSPGPRRLHVVGGEVFKLVTVGGASPSPGAGGGLSGKERAAAGGGVGERKEAAKSAGLRGLGIGYSLPTITVTEWAEEL